MKPQKQRTVRDVWQRVGEAVVSSLRPKDLAVLERTLDQEQPGWRSREDQPEFYIGTRLRVRACFKVGEEPRVDVVLV